MKRGGYIQRRRPLKARNRKRAAQRLARDFGKQAAFCRECYCAMCGKPPPSDPHHEPPRSREGRDGDTVPLCRVCHTKRHQVGARAFWRDVDEPERVKRDVWGSMYLRGLVAS